MAISRSRPPGRGLGVAVVIAVVVTTGWPAGAEGSQRSQDERAAVATAAASLRPAVVVLKSGERLQAKSVSRTQSELLIRFADGHTETYPIAEVDLGASEDIPRLSSPRSAAARGRRSTSNDLASFARTAKLTIPEDSGRPLSRTEGSTPGGGTLSTGSLLLPTAATPAPATQADQDSRHLPAELRTYIQEFANGWSGYRRALAEVKTVCSGYTQGRASCGGSAVVSNRNTAFCRDAINRARTHLPRLESLHSSLWAEARLAGTSPGEVRSLLRARGLADFRTRLDQARSDLDAWFGNLVE